MIIKLKLLKIFPKEEECVEYICDKFSALSTYKIKKMNLIEKCFKLLATFFSKHEIHIN